MEDMSKYCHSENLYDGKSELFRVYYDKNSSFFEEFLLIELLAISEAYQNKWQIFKAFKSEIINDIIIISKN